MNPDPSPGVAADAPDLTEAEGVAREWLPAGRDGRAIFRVMAEYDRRGAELEQTRAHILDIDAHATPFGDIPDDPGWVGTYLLTAGALHRAVGTIGHTAPSCTAEAEADQLRAQRDAALALLTERAIDLDGDEWVRVRPVRQALGAETTDG